MEHLNYVVGLDIGTTKIVAIVAKIDVYDKIEIIGIGSSRSLGVKRGVVSNITSTVESIKQAVKAAEDSSGKKIKKIFVGVAGQHIRSLQHSDYIIRDKPDQVIDVEDVDNLCKQVYNLALNEGERIIHVLPQEFKVDGQPDIREPIGMYGARLEASFHVVFGKNSAIKNIGDCVRMAGLELTGTVLEPIASSDSVLTQEEKEAGVALIDIGGGTTDLAIFKDGIIRHTAVIPFGGNIITEDIREGCFIIERYAEQIKVKYGSTWPGENKDNEIITVPGLKGREPKEISKKSLSKIIHARITEIISQAFSEVQSYGYQEQKKKLIGGIVLTGGGSQLQHLKQLTEYITGMETRIGFPNEHLSGNTPKEIANPIFSTSVGLALNAMRSEPINTEEVSSEEESIMNSVMGESHEEFKNQEKDTEQEENLEQEDFSSSAKRRKSYAESLYERWKNFLEKAE